MHTHTHLRYEQINMDGLCKYLHCYYNAYLSLYNYNVWNVIYFISTIDHIELYYTLMSYVVCVHVQVLLAHVVCIH